MTVEAITLLYIVFQECNKAGLRPLAQGLSSVWSLETQDLYSYPPRTRALLSGGNGAVALSTLPLQR